MIWDWELGVLAFALGLGLGFLLTWQMAPRNDRIRELEKELDAARAELVAYRDKVNLHFQTSATLFEDMTERYRAVYQHLASSAQELCAVQPPALQMDVNTSARLATPAQVVDAGDASSATAAPERNAMTAADDAYLGDAPHIPELTDEVDVPVSVSADKTPPTAAH